MIIIVLLLFIGGSVLLWVEYQKLIERVTVLEEKISQIDSGAVGAEIIPDQQERVLEQPLRRLPDDFELTELAPGQEAVDECLVKKEPVVPGEPFYMNINGNDILMEPVNNIGDIVNDVDGGRE